MTQPAEPSPLETDPPTDELADDRDEDGWDSERDGSMADHAAPDDAVVTVPVEDDTTARAQTL